MNSSKLGRVLVFGANGMVGNAVVRCFRSSPIVASVIASTRADLDLLDYEKVCERIVQERPDCIVLAAAKVGGIEANNNYPAEFIFNNLKIQQNVIHGAFMAGVERLIFLGSSCIYPKYAVQPIVEESLLEGGLEATNEPYAIAKIAGIKMCEAYNRQYGCDYRSVMPTNLYGLRDNYHHENSHVIPGLIRRIHEAKLRKLSQIEVWGSGLARREFLFSDDLAAAILTVASTDKSAWSEVSNSRCSHVNVGYGEDISIRELAEKLVHIMGYTGVIVYDESKPDGTPRKLMCSRRIMSLGWKPLTDLDNGLNLAYSDFLERELA